MSKPWVSPVKLNGENCPFGLYVSNDFDYPAVWAKLGDLAHFYGTQDYARLVLMPRASSPRGPNSPYSMPLRKCPTGYTSELGTIAINWREVNKRWQEFLDEDPKRAEKYL